MAAAHDAKNTMTANQDSAPPWRPHEAQVLAALLRTTRLTVLYSESMAVASTLLREGVLPLLRTHTGEVVLDDRRVEQRRIDFPDRRVPGARPRLTLAREVPVYLDDWEAPPLRSLRTLAQLAVPEVAQALSAEKELSGWLRTLREHSVRLLIVLDRFEGFVNAPPDRVDLQRFTYEFIQALNEPNLPVSVLIAVQQDAAPGLKRLRRRIPFFGEHAMRLWSREDGSFALTPLSENESELQDAAGTAARPALKAEDVYSSIEQLLQKTHAPDNVAPWSQPTPNGAPPASQLPLLLPDAATPIAAAPPEPWLEASPEAATLGNTAASTPRARPSRSAPLPSFAARKQASRLRLVAIALGVVLPLGVAGWLWSTAPNRPSAAAQRSVVSGTGAGAGTTLHFEFLTDAEASTDARIGADLAVELAPAIEFTPGALSAGLKSAQGGAPRVAIARDDELQQLREAGADALPLRTVMPLYLEEVHFIVRADSPLTFVHQIKGRHINIGPPRGGRALTASRLYEAMFGARLPSWPGADLPQEAALQQMLAGRGVDVIVVVDAQPSVWLASLKPEVARALKLLKLDRRHPASQNALRLSQSATVRSESYRNGLVAQQTPTLAVRAFLVTAAVNDEAVPDALRSLAHSLCRKLPTLQDEGHPKWQELRPGLQGDAPWPYSTAAAQGFRSCLVENKTRS
jgi:hypothetical protein